MPPPTAAIAGSIHPWGLRPVSITLSGPGCSQALALCSGGERRLAHIYGGLAAAQALPGSQGQPAGQSSSQVPSCRHPCGPGRTSWAPAGDTGWDWEEKNGGGNAQAEAVPVQGTQHAPA